VVQRGPAFPKSTRTDLQYQEYASHNMLMGGTTTPAATTQPARRCAKHNQRVMTEHGWQRPQRLMPWYCGAPAIARQSFGDKELKAGRGGRTSFLNATQLVVKPGPMAVNECSSARPFDEPFRTNSAVGADAYCCSWPEFRAHGRGAGFERNARSSAVTTFLPPG
jgi:hypothetical protein